MNGRALCLRGGAGSEISGKSRGDEPEGRSIRRHSVHSFRERYIDSLGAQEVGRTVVPHFEVITIDGQMVAYASIWQQKNLVLVVLPPDDPGADVYAASLSSRASDIAAHAAQCVITKEPVAELSPPAILIADRWGEVAIAVSGTRVTELPSVDEVFAWLEHIQHKCPECEGESR